MAKRPSKPAPKSASKTEKHNIVLQLIPLKVDVSTLTIDPQNARTHSAQNLETIRESLLRFGQYQPIVVQQEGMVVRAGNGRLSVMRELGWTHCAAVVLPADQVEMALLALTDNRSSDTSEFDLRMLSDQIKQLNAIPGLDLKLYGWSEHDLDPLLKSNWQPPSVDPQYTPTVSAKVSKGVAVTFTPEQYEHVRRVVQAIGKGKDDATVIVEVCKAALPDTQPVRALRRPKAVSK